MVKRVHGSRHFISGLRSLVVGPQLIRAKCLPHIPHPQPPPPPLPHTNTIPAVGLEGDGPT
jgi:hypothetical protein